MIQELLGSDSLVSWDAALKTLGGCAVLYMGREFSKMRKTMDRWEVAFFGLNGDNGINGNVKMLMKEREERIANEDSTPRRRVIRRRQEDE